MSLLYFDTIQDCLDYALPELIATLEDDFNSMEDDDDGKNIMRRKIHDIEVLNNLLVKLYS